MKLLERIWRLLSPSKSNLNERMLTAVFELLVEYVEIEMPWGPDPLDPSNASKYETEILEACEGDEELFEQLLEVKTSLLDAYEYWKTIRPEIVEKIDICTARSHIENMTVGQMINLSILEDHLSHLDDRFLSLVTRHRRSMWS
jgi:hypothetical protein